MAFQVSEAFPAQSEKTSILVFLEERVMLEFAIKTAFA